MQRLMGTKNEVSVRLWIEQIEKHFKRATDSMECVRRFAEVDDLTHLIEDCEKLIENAKHAKDLMENRINVI